MFGKMWDGWRKKKELKTEGRSEGREPDHGKREVGKGEGREGHGQTETAGDIRTEDVGSER